MACANFSRVRKHIVSSLSGYAVVSVAFRLLTETHSQTKRKKAEVWVAICLLHSLITEPMIAAASACMAAPPLVPGVVKA